jgi:ribose-phosphate pyrophosphokinase
MTALVLGFADSRDAAARLGAELGLAVDEVAVRRFPDGEALVRVPRGAPTVILYRSLDHPDAKLVELILAAAAARDAGAGRVVLVAPYLAYMRQDMAFHPGEAVSQRVIGALIADHFDALLTVDPHLHRIATLGEAVPRIPALALSAASVLRECIALDERPVIVGPDSESRAWTQSIAGPLGLDMLVGEKERRGDRAVSIVIEGIERVAGRPAILVDDVVSSGRTLQIAAELLRAAGATRVEALATHCLASDEDLAALRASGIVRLTSSDSVAGPTAQLPLAPILADALRTAGLA